MSDSKKLRAIEKRIGDNIKAAWYQNGLLLIQIRDEKLYTDKYATFENYITERWQFSRQRGYQLLDAASLTQKIEFLQSENLTEKGENCKQIVDILPANEGQIRPLLTSLKTDSERIAVWKNVVYDSQGDEVKITAAYVQNKVDEFIASGEVIEDVDYEINHTVNLSTGVTHSSTGTNDWYTPQEHIEAARSVMGSIDTDPASSKNAQVTVKAENYFTKENSGLDKEWNGKVFMNPPYSMPEIKQFTDKLIREIEAGRVDEAIILTNNSSDTSWFHSLLSASTMACLTKGRINFYSKDGEKGMATRQGQCFFYVGSNQEKFSSTFKQFGAIIQTL
jgi:phage N-6-adenine-methyltransferase